MVAVMVLIAPSNFMVIGAGIVQRTHLVTGLHNIHPSILQELGNLV